MIEVQGLKKTYYVHKKEPGLRGSIRSLFRREQVAKEALKEISFKVGEGEIVGIVGANGAGKTTLVKMLAGIVHPTAGTARVLGFTPWERDDELRRQIALIMGQKAQLWWDLPAADCFLLLKEIYRVPDARYKATLDYLVEVLDIGDELNVQIRRLSLGERMKMELIAALLHSPRVVYLDEPTIGLDLTAQRAIRDFILQYREEHRPAMLVTSHYMEDIRRLCPRIIILREGEMVYDGPLQSVVDRYADTKVLRAHMHRTGKPPAVPPELAAMGEVVECSAGTLCLRVPRAAAAAASARLLDAFDVVDFSIEEVDIETIIERIFRERGAVDV